MSTKVCFKCNIEQSLDDFYNHSKMFDGKLGKCKSCTKLDIKTRVNKLSKDPNWLELEKTRHRDKYYRLGYKNKHKPSYESKKLIMDKYKQKYPEKIKARNYVQYLTRINSENELHHWSYNDEHFKDVIELSVEKHNFIHRFLVYDQLSKMYYRIDTKELLSTKEKHLEYINTLKKEEKCVKI